MVNGEGKLKLENGLRPIHEGDIVIINPTTLHTEITQEKNCLEYFVCAVENITFNTLSDTSDKKDNVFIHSIDDSDGRKLLLGLFQKAEAELATQKLFYEVYTQSLINEALIYILRKTNLKNIENESAAVPNECAFVKQYIDMHFSEKVTLEDIAQKTYFSKFYIIHSFKKHFGITPFKYLLSKRLEEAENLLITTNMSVTSISSGIGFSSPSQLSKAFKQKHGITPQQFRARRSSLPA